MSVQTTIYERSVIVATNTDIMSAGRLNSIPYSGLLTIRLSADLANATNAWTFTVQLPGGAVPVDAQTVPGSNPSLGGIIDERTCWKATYRVPQGGHVTLSLTETGAAICTIELFLQPG